MQTGLSYIFLAAAGAAALWSFYSLRKAFQAKLLVQGVALAVLAATDVWSRMSDSATALRYYRYSLLFFVLFVIFNLFILTPGAKGEQGAPEPAAEPAPANAE